MFPKGFKTRIAPTPSGFLHAGNVFNFLLIKSICDQWGGQLGLRIDDLDAGRTRCEFVDDIFIVLQDLNIKPEFGPKAADEFWKSFSQLAHKNHYWEFVQRLLQQGKAYACSCSRKDYQARSQDHLYHGNCRDRGLEFVAEETAVRLFVDDESLQKTMGDFVIWRKDNLPAYQLVSVVEDTQSKVNLIVRGEDLVDSTKAQLYLAKQLGLDSFLQIHFIHHELLKDKTGQKLSKSQSHGVAGRLAERFDIQELKTKVDLARRTIEKAD